MMDDHGLVVTDAGGSVMLGLALVMAWLQLRGGGLRPLIARSALSVSGYLRSRPDPALEAVLRSAFTQLDKELAAVLGDQPVPRP